jgi:hypothetical protein
MVQTPNHFKQMRSSGRQRMVSTHTTILGNAYDPASDLTRPTLSFPCKDIISINDVTVWSDGGYTVRVSAKSKNAATGGLQIVVRCYQPTNVTGPIITNHAAHTHTVTTIAPAGGGVALKANGGIGGSLDTAGGAMVGVAGVQNTLAAMAHAQAAAASGGAELNKDNNQFTIYGTAIGYV